MIFRPNFQFIKWIWQSYKDIVFSVPGVPIDWFRNVINISLLEGLSFGLYICINCNGVDPKKTYSNNNCGSVVGFSKTFFGKVVEKLWMMRKSGDAFQWRLNELLTALWPGF